MLSLKRVTYRSGAKELEKFGIYDLPYQELLKPTEKITRTAPDALAEEVKRAKFS